MARGFAERIQLKSPDQLDIMRRAGLVVARALREMRAAVAPGVTTADLDAVARDVLRDEGATSNFLGYDVGTGPYPAVICSSVNDRVVHGIPSRDEKLAEGDLVSIDFGAVVDGWHGDAAITVGVGEVRPARRRCGPESPPREPAAGSATSRMPWKCRCDAPAGTASSPDTADTGLARPCTWLRTSSTTVRPARARAWCAG
jgi:methionine aminopeptidase